MVVIGIDPGRIGGGVLCENGTTLAAWTWRNRTRKGREVFTLTGTHRTGTIHEVRGLPTPWEVGLTVRDWIAPLVLLHGRGTCHIAAEAAHIGRNPRTGLALSRFGGSLVGPLETWDPTRRCQWVEPDEWRRTSFRPKWWKVTAEDHGMVANRQVAKREGVPFMEKREAAKREAARVLPLVFQGLDDLVERLNVDPEHIHDAAGVARWRMVKG